jgi:hypothetical protein
VYLTQTDRRCGTSSSFSSSFSSFVSFIYEGEGDV